MTAVAALGPRHHDVKRLRALLRERRARAEAGAFVLEGPRLVADALRRGAPVELLYLGPDAEQAFVPLITTARRAGIPIVALKEGVLEKLGSTRTPQPVLAIAPMPQRAGLAGLHGPGPVLVAVGVADPGNLGTLVRSAEAAGAAGVVVCGDAVDVWNPKVVRASAGSVLGVPLVDATDPAAALDALRAAGRRIYGTAASGGTQCFEADLSGPLALVLGSEAHGVPSTLHAHLDDRLTIPMIGAGESLNVAVAGSVLLFEAARQRAHS